MKAGSANARLITCTLLMVLILAACQTAARTLNGFDVSNASIPADEIFKGGPPRDGIPALTDPKYVAPGQASYLAGEDRVMGVVIEGTPHAYPVGIMNYHEIVNHSTDQGQWLISYCPLCGTGMVFDAEVSGRELTFGVSGLLYNSDLLMYDRQTESLWSQIEGRAVSGPLKGKELELMPSRLTSWKAWRAEHPDTRVLSRDTGHRRNYDSTPYGNYEQSSTVFFPIAERDDRYHPKAWVIGMTSGDKARAWPFKELKATGKETIQDTFDGRELTIHFDAENRSARITNDAGKELAATTGFWFAWHAFHPDTQVFTGK